MSNLLNLDALDTDGAIRESAESAGLDRSDFLKKGALAGGGLIAGSAFFTQYLGTAEAVISKRRSKANDVRILNFALTLEFLEAEFYAQARENRAFGDNAALERFTRVVARHEGQHVSFLRGALGSSAIRKPTFGFGDTVKDTKMFADTAQVLEDTGVSAYLGQATNILQAPVLKAAGTIVTVEARHAAWIRFINGGAGLDTPTRNLPAPATFDTPKSEAAILSAVRKTKFIK